MGRTQSRRRDKDPTVEKKDILWFLRNWIRFCFCFLRENPGRKHLFCINLLKCRFIVNFRQLQTGCCCIKGPYRQRRAVILDRDVSAEPRLVRKGSIILDQDRRFLSHLPVEGVSGNKYQTLKYTICSLLTYNPSYVATRYVGHILHSIMETPFFFILSCL